MGAWHVRWEMMTQVGWGVGGEEGEAEETERLKLMGGRVLADPRKMRERRARSRRGGWHWCWVDGD